MEHGSVTEYRYGCRCAKCSAAHAESNKVTASKYGVPRNCKRCNTSYVYKRNAGMGTKICKDCQPEPRTKTAEYGHSHVPCTVCQTLHLNVMHRYYPVCDKCWPAFPKELVRQLKSHHATTDFVRRCAQNPTCWACSKDVLVKVWDATRGAWKFSFALDHDHNCCPGRSSCGACLRGLLCSTCNTALGYLHDDPVKVWGLARYLQSVGADQR